MTISIEEEAKEFGWLIKKPSQFQKYQFIFKSEEMHRSSECAYLPSQQSKTLCQDDGSSIQFYIGIRCLSDVFSMSTPVIGGLPRCVTQDQLHWLRKVVKSSILSTKPLRLGNYVVTFQALCTVYEMGAEFGLLKRDIDINNKTEQASAERLISQECLLGLSLLHWGKATQFLIYIARIGFNAWWKVDLTIVERIAYSYYVCKVVHLWLKWVKLSKLPTKSCFITLELFRDTLVMCSSMTHLALSFKLFHPSLPFIPWNWSEFPVENHYSSCLLYTSPSPRDKRQSRMPSSA